MLLAALGLNLQSTRAEKARNTGADHFVRVAVGRTPEFFEKG